MEYDRVATCAERIKKALTIKEMRQSDLCRLTKIPKSALSQYLSGVYEPKQDRIYLMAKALNVNETWLMGLDVPMERQEKKVSPSGSDLSEGEKMWLEIYHRLSDDTRVLMVNMMDSFDRIPEDKQKLALQMIRVALGNQE
jgi:transcriptional regulator with XRE-family HTH domain